MMDSDGDGIREIFGLRTHKGRLENFAILAQFASSSAAAASVADGLVTATPPERGMTRRTCDPMESLSRYRNLQPAPSWKHYGSTRVKNAAQSQQIVRCWVSPRVNGKSRKLRKNSRFQVVVHGSFDTAHNLKVVSSNPTPATKISDKILKA